MLQQLERQNQKLSEPLASLKIEIDLLQKQLTDQKQIIDDKDILKNRIEEKYDYFRKLEYEYEVKLQ